jgi:hypothetical protein
LKHLKAKIVRLNVAYHRAMLIDTGVQERLGCEEPFLHHLIQGRKRQKQRMIHMICDKNGTRMTSSPDILRAFAEHHQCKYASISVCGERMQPMMECDLPKVPDAANLALAEPVTLEEIFQAIKSGKLKRPLAAMLYATNS